MRHSGHSTNIRQRVSRSTQLAATGIVLLLLANVLSSAHGIRPIGLVEAAPPPARLSAAPHTAEIRIEQMSYTMLINTDLIVNLVISGAEDVGGWEVLLGFDPAYVEVAAVTPGDFLSSTGRTATGLGPMQQTQGQVSIGGYTYGAQPGADGSGVLAQITLRGIAVGSTTLSVSSPLLATLDAAGGVQTQTPTTQGAQVNVTQPLAVTLAGFGATIEQSGVDIAWETVSETDNTGFNLVRVEAQAGPRQTLAFVPSQAPGSGQGSSYHWIDADVVAGQRYFYWLEAVSLDGSVTRYGPLRVDFQSPTAVTIGGFSVGSDSRRETRWQHH